MPCKKCKHEPATAGLLGALGKLLFRTAAKRTSKAVVKKAAKKAAANAAKSAAVNYAVKRATTKKRKPQAGVARARPRGVGRAGAARARPHGVGRAGARILRADQRVV